MSTRPTSAVSALALVAVSVLTGPVPAAATGNAGYCPDAGGVTVVVDFKELGGGTVVRCAPGDQATGLAALKNAGFQIAGTLRWGEGFICRIEGKPSASAERCIDTPPASAYWSYWHAPNGGSWTYSDKGVLNRRPPPGSFEGWSFSVNRNADDAPRPGAAPARPAPPPRTTPAAPPRTAPPAPPRTTAPAPRPSSPPTTPPPAAGGNVVPTGTAPAGTTGPPAPAAVGSTSAAGPPVATAETPPVVVGVPPRGAAATPTDKSTDSFTPTEISASRDTGELPVGTIAGLLVLVALVGGGLVAARRRSVASDD
ncbi:hypothetical protein HCA58_12900 [Micromonospora sp. HNM0581]|uniref:hypothetical protein n=1 Tax=Micromonospora sp. HNM0581 TaxID=2716341 RepID=UPI00146F33A0|nr:hypothetical protein [Micromonospora sp. HNM0581]NLU79260.1 hypothetical protein [Micromonospora sp. HNM0581]